jgi:hypothetical protein
MSHSVFQNVRIISKNQTISHESKEPTNHGIISKYFVIKSVSQALEELSEN